MSRKRLIDLLCRRDPSLSREQYLARILCGEIRVNGQIIRDPQQHFAVSVCIEALPSQRFVSRGGSKLEAVLQDWQIDVRGLTVLDAGASSGGFTDCLLQNGAKTVYAVDVGYNQLDYRLRNDSRVIVRERTNIMSLHCQDFPHAPDAAVADLSFRSLRRAAAHLLNLVNPGWLIALVKPQFEWQQPDTDFAGIVDPTKLKEILNSLVVDLSGEAVFVAKVMLSPLRGRKGNREFFFLLSLEPSLDQKQLEKMLAKVLQDDLLSGEKGVS